MSTSSTCMICWEPCNTSRLDCDCKSEDTGFLCPCCLEKTTDLKCPVCRKFLRKAFNGRIIVVFQSVLDYLELNHEQKTIDLRNSEPLDILNKNQGLREEIWKVVKTIYDTSNVHAFYYTEKSLNYKINCRFVYKQNNTTSEIRTCKILRNGKVRFSHGCFLKEASITIECTSLQPSGILSRFKDMIYRFSGLLKQ